MHQITGFHFSVKFQNLPEEKEVDMGFQSISGLDVEIQTETLKEGGENRFEHTIPGRRKYSRLTLKRGILKPKDSSLTAWCQKAFQDMEITPIGEVIVSLLDENHNPLMQWELNWVYPISWKVNELNAEKGEVLIETFELSYNRFRLIDVN